MLVIKNLEAYYDQIQALKGVSLHVDRGEVVCLIGANGAGKTTTLHSVSGLMKRVGGEIVLEGKTIRNLSPERIVCRGAVSYTHLTLPTN